MDLIKFQIGFNLEVGQSNQSLLYGDKLKFSLTTSGRITHFYWSNNILVVELSIKNLIGDLEFYIKYSIEGGANQKDRLPW